MKHRLVFHFLLLCVTSDLPAQGNPQRPVFLSYEKAQPILSAMEEILPSELKGKNSTERSKTWPVWLARHDVEIRSRLVRGEEDTLVNFLLFGTSFTRQPRITPGDFAQSMETDLTQREELLAGLDPKVRRVIQARIEDLVRGIRSPGNNERLLFLQKLVQQKGYNLLTSSDRIRLKGYIRANLVRMLQESKRYAETLAAAKLQGDPNEEFIERSKLFRDRGLSLDTSLPPNFALEESLKAIQSRHLLEPGSVHRVAIIGPGLDFTDKQSGYDFYPQQTLQPFALVDSLHRTGLAPVDKLEVVAFDISPRIIAHLNHARRQALQGKDYVVQLPLDPDVPWDASFMQYWKEFGGEIGRPVAPLHVPSEMKILTLRAVRFPSKLLARIVPINLNVVTEHLSIPESERFDLIVATNIFVYYDVFEQSLALANVEEMLRPGGLLLSNNALLELPGSKIHSVDYLTVVYSSRADDGDHIVWYRRSLD